METILKTETVEGEIGIVIGYSPGQTHAIHVLQAAIGMVQAMDKLDAVLLSSIDTQLEPVSILNDIQHSSFKMLLRRMLLKVPDKYLNSLDWRAWAGDILVQGKYRLLQKLDADAPEVQRALDELAPAYQKPPGEFVDFVPPSVSDVMDALEVVSKARNVMAGHAVTIETALGDVSLPDLSVFDSSVQAPHAVLEERNIGTEYFKIKSPDMLGSAQWTIQRNKRSVRVRVLHQDWLDAYHQRKFALLPGDSLKCKFEERVLYDQNGTEIERHLSIIEVLDIISPPTQQPLL